MSKNKDFTFWHDSLELSSRELAPRRQPMRRYIPVVIGLAAGIVLAMMIALNVPVTAIVIVMGLILFWCVMLFIYNGGDDGEW